MKHTVAKIDLLKVIATFIRALKVPSIYFAN